MKKTVVELFAGVGGFRVGLNNINSIDANGHAIESGHWSFVWANQWEPATKSQDAFDCYNKRFADGQNSNVDISKVNIPIISKVFKGQMSRKQKNYINYMSQKTSNYTNHVGIYTKNPIKRFLEDRKTKKLPSVTRTTEQNEEFIRRLSSTQPISLDPDRNKTPEQIAQENARQEARNRMTSESRENSGSER